MKVFNSDEFQLIYVKGKKAGVKILPEMIFDGKVYSGTDDGEIFCKSRAMNGGCAVDYRIVMIENKAGIFQGRGHGFSPILTNRACTGQAREIIRNRFLRCWRGRH